MTIEIHQPELEALILSRMQEGRSVEQIMLEAFHLPHVPPANNPSNWRAMRGIARGGGDSLTDALIQDRAAENAHDKSRL